MSLHRLIVMRHAKSSWGTAVADHERPLNGRGQKDAPTIGRALVDWGWVPDLVYSSDSARTTETWQMMAPVLGRPVEVHFMRELYLAGISAFESVVETAPNTAHTLLLLGHNPGWEHIVGELSGEMHQMTTANAVLLEKQASDWVDAMHGQGLWRVENVLRPRPPRNRTTPR